LLAYVARTAARKGWCRITLEVRRDNTGARRLYRNAGFTGGRHPMYFLTKEIR
jgi:ribosomal protein S18 acetylase RimI-like enzyme